jgi:ATP-dependent exoDNAse (exonuclease V) beta subunit
VSIKPPSDADVRLAAVDPVRSFLIEAPAGSGKTELLTDRILALLATVNRPEEIVAITFTRKAASEMHARVLAKLRAALGDAPSEGHKRRSWQLAQKAMRRNDELGWDLLGYPARLSIRTIDSFCAHLVRAMPWLSALGGLPAVAEDAQEHYQAAAQATLAMADESEAVAALIAHLDVDLRVAQNLLATMLASRDQWLPLLTAGGDVDRLLAALNHSIAIALQALGERMPEGWAAALAPPVSRAAETLATAGAGTELDALRDWEGEPLGVACEDLPKWQALAWVLLTKENNLRVGVNKNQGFEAKSDYKEAFVKWAKSAKEQTGTDREWVAALGAIKFAPAQGYTDAQIETLRVLIKSLWLASAQLTLRFTQADEVDFIEISQRALHALGEADEPSDLLLKLDVAIRHILVDEFQDTSQSQIDLLQRLTTGWEPGDGRTVFLVGDPKQSIYRFRKAEVGWFLKVQQHGLGEVPLTALKLTDNFRSQANVVAWVNGAFGKLFPQKSNPAMGAIKYSESVAFNPAIDGLGMEFHPIWLPFGSDGEHKDQAQAAAESIAINLIREALARHPDSEHPVAVLVRARAHLGKLVHRLMRENIPCRAVELVSLKQRQVVDDLVQLTRALSHPADRLAWLSVLRSPLCGLTLESLHALFGGDHRLTVPAVLSAWLNQDEEGPLLLDPAESQRLRRVACILLDNSNDSGAVPFAAWLEQCWRRLGGPSVYASPGDLADAERLFRQIEELAPYGGLNPAELEARLNQLYAAPNSPGHAVEVMTIHKAKGMEFDTVVLMGLDRKARSDSVPLVRFEQNEGELLLGPIKHRILDEPDPVSSYLAEREKVRAGYETDRLLYVAATRAREQLHLIGAVSLDENGEIKMPAASSLLGRLWDHIEKPERPSMAEIMEGDSAGTASPHSGGLIRMRDVAWPKIKPPAARPSGTPWQWRPQSGDEALIGTVAHAWLERMGKEGADHWPPERVAENVPLISKQLSRAGVAGAAISDATRIVQETLQATLASSRGQWLLSVARAHREWSLLDLSGRVSIIDLAISQESGWLVVDYKTGAPAAHEDRDSFIAHMRTRYQEQIARYCAHVSALDGRAATGALYFPRADIWIEC